MSQYAIQSIPIGYPRGAAPEAELRQANPVKAASLRRLVQFLRAAGARLLPPQKKFHSFEEGRAFNTTMQIQRSAHYARRF